MGLKEQLKDHLPGEVLSSLSDHFDVIGEIAVLSLPEELIMYRHVIADAIISRRRSIRTVLNKCSRLKGINRTARYEILAGSDMVTLHKEYDFSYRLDVGAVFYNPRLASERRRVIDQVNPGEQVLVPFCGVGPFVIPAAARGATVIAIEQNPDACRWFRENVVLNGLEDRITLIAGDAFDLDLLPPGPFDRVIIPTPYGLDTIFGILVPLVKPGGTIHFYTFCTRNQADIRGEAFTRNGFDLIEQRRCGNVAPGISRWVFDLKKPCYHHFPLW